METATNSLVSDISIAADSLSLHLLLTACHLINACSAYHFIEESVKENSDGTYVGILFSPKNYIICVNINNGETLKPGIRNSRIME